MASIPPGQVGGSDAAPLARMVLELAILELSLWPYPSAFPSVLGSDGNLEPEDQKSHSPGWPCPFPLRILEPAIAGEMGFLIEFLYGRSRLSNPGHRGQEFHSERVRPVFRSRLPGDLGAGGGAGLRLGKWLMGMWVVSSVLGVVAAALALGVTGKVFPEVLPVFGRRPLPLFGSSRKRA